jgi:hypothetical protein
MRVSSFSEIEKEFIERAHRMVWCSAATCDTRNRLRSRVLHPIWEGATGWVGTRRHSLKEKHLAYNPYLSLAYISEPANPVYADCTAEWEYSLAGKEHAWELFRSAAPPLGFDYGKIFESPTDPEFGLLKLRPWRIEIFDMAPDKRKVWLSSGI